MVMSAKLRVLVADDHAECRWAIVRLLRVEFEVVAAVATEASSLMRRCHCCLT